MVNQKSKIRPRKEGSTLLATIIILTVLGAVFASVISLGLTERKINVRHEARLEAKTVAESLLEYAFAQMETAFSEQTNLPADTFDSLDTPPASFFGDKVVSNSFEVVASDVSSTTGFTVLNQNDPLNAKDPMKGKRLFIKEVTAYAKATVNPPVGSTDITAYAKQTLQIRDSPIFSHAIFYNLDLDIHNGPLMNISGPVHTNGSLRVNTLHGLNFLGPVTAAKNLLHAYEHLPDRDQGTITFVNANGDSVPMLNNHGTTLDHIIGSTVPATEFLDSNSAGENFRAVASELWDGNLMTSQHGVEEYQPVQFSDYQPDDPTTNEYDPINTGHDLIEPPLKVNHSEYNTSVEDQKMANKAGLYFSWNTTTNTITAKNKDGQPITNIDDFEGTLWTHTADAFYDGRRNKDIDIIDINTGVLKTLIESPGTAASERLVGFDPDDDWNGIVYFESFSDADDGNSGLGDNAAGEDSSNTNASETTNLAASGTENSVTTSAIVVHNGPTDPKNLNYSGIRLSGGQTNITGQGIPSKGADKGMTFATNNALYIQGHYNADGTIESDSSTAVDNSNEVPAALMADTVTFLSSNWSDANSAASMYNRVATPTEVSAAVISGITPGNTTKDGVTSTYNGGAHNLPRYLENWNNVKFAIRGSLVCLYEAEVDWSIWEVTFYSPPLRDYGFSDLFNSGIFPPGTPLLRNYKRLSFESLSKAEYDSEISNL